MSQIVNQLGSKNRSLAIRREYEKFLDRISHLHKDSKNTMRYIVERSEKKEEDTLRKKISQY